MFDLHSATPKCIGTGFLALDIVVEGQSSDPQNFAAGGTCGNVLSILAMFGWESVPVARLGNDAAARILINDLRCAGVSTDALLLVDEVPTPMIVHRYGIGAGSVPRHRFEWNCPTCGSHLPRFRPTPWKELERHVHRLLSSQVFFFDRATPGALRLAEQAGQAGSIVFFEPPKFVVGDPLFDRAIGLSDIVKVASSVGKTAVLEQALAAVPLALITIGEHGLKYRVSGFLGEEQDWIERPPVEVSRVIDACGSGDWLTAGFLYALLNAANDGEVLGKIEESLAFGQALSALNCQVPGARGLMAHFQPEEIREMAQSVVSEYCLTFRRTTLNHSGDAVGICPSCSQPLALATT